MNLDNKKLLIGILILFAYISVGIFGLFQFSHLSEERMDNCPYAQGGSSVCKTNFDHINNWRQFSNTTFSALFVFALFMLGIVLYFFDKQIFFHQKQYFYKWKYYLYNIKLYVYRDGIIKWLSLFENSPSLSLVRHN